MQQTRKHGRGITLTLTLGIAILGCSLGGKAAEGQELVTDRPDFTESAIVVPAGTVQIESGFTWIDESTSEALSGPEVLVRWGLSERLELRIGLPDWVDPRGGSSGVGDSSIGAKFQFGPTDNGWDVGLIGTLSIPTGDSEFTSDEVDPELIFTVSHDLPAGWSFGTQLAIARITEENVGLNALAATIVLGKGLTGRIGLFAEIVVEEVEEADTALLLHHGYTFLLHERLQLDVHLGVGLSDDAADSLIGLGLTWRSP